VTQPSSAIEQHTKAFLTELLMDVPITRAQGTAQERLQVLERAILYTPVFQNWPSPIDEWLAEAEDISSEQHRTDALATVMLRRAVVQMRRLEYDAALAELERVRDSVGPLSPAHLTWHTATRSRVLTRQQQFDKARQALSDVASIRQDGWTSLLPSIAEGELQLEANEVDAASKTLRRALSLLPDELIEEQVNLRQLLGFVFITQANAPRALHYLDEARKILRGAGAWMEVTQMNLVVGSFHVAAANHTAAELRFTEASQLCRLYPQPHLEPLLQVGLARSKAVGGRAEEAVGAVLEAATLYARQHNVVGFVSMIVLIGNLYAQSKNYAEAYRLLAIGLTIAKRYQWLVVERVLRGHIDRLRNDVMGPRDFDEMVQQMIQTMKGEGVSRE
jgi:tetratricopeptide (TPR) repeat protein